MTELLKKQLDEIVGKKFNYKGKNVLINSYKEVSGTNIIVFANERPLNFLVNEIPAFLEELCEPLIKDIEKNQIAVPKKEMLVFEPTKENATIKQTLMDTLKRVSEDKEYIPQAQTVCDIVNQMVNIQKTEIQMIGILNKNK